MEEIEALVNRHQDRLHVGVFWIFFFFSLSCYLLCSFESIIFQQMETFQSTNKGYHAELNVVTYCRNRTAIEDKSKFRILLVSFFFLFKLLHQMKGKILKKVIFFAMYCLIL